MSEENKPQVKRLATAILAGVGAFVIAIVLVGFGLVAWEHFTTVRSELETMDSEFRQVRATLEKIDKSTSQLLLREEWKEAKPAPRDIATIVNEAVDAGASEDEIRAALAKRHRH
jgi:uncharacterized membrane protein YhiD involved in acid resistance